MRLRQALTEACWRSASTAVPSKTSLLRVAAFCKVATMIRSAIAAAIRWLGVKRGRAVLVGLLPRLSTWLCYRDTASSYDGGWAAIAILRAKAGGSILSRWAARGYPQPQTQ